MISPIAGPIKIYDQRTPYRLLGTLHVSQENYSRIFLTLKAGQEYGMAFQTDRMPVDYAENVLSSTAGYVKYLIIRASFAEFDGVHIFGPSLSDIDGIDGWSFSPSIAYIQDMISRMIADKTGAC